MGKIRDPIDQKNDTPMTATGIWLGVLLNSMYELPTMENVSKIVVDESVIDGDAEPLILYENTQQTMAASE